MTKRFKIKISKILSLKSCRSKNLSDLPFIPIPTIHHRRPLPPPNNFAAVFTTTTVSQRRRSFFRLHVLTAFGCASSPRRRSPSPSLSPPQTPSFKWESEGKWHVIAAQVNEKPRRKIYNGVSENSNLRRSLKKDSFSRRRKSVSSAEEYEEETERENLLLSSTNFSPEHYSSDLPRGTQRRRRKTKSKSTLQEVKSKSSPPSSPARLSSFVQRLMACTAAPANVTAVTGDITTVTENVTTETAEFATETAEFAAETAEFTAEAAVVVVKKELSPPLSPARQSSFMQRLIPCTAVAAAEATAHTAVVEGVAVVKRSEDPYEDFKGSMIEMIIEKKMFQVDELEQLLRCFLTLNAKRHHRDIVKAFSEVWVDLFTDYGINQGSSQRSSDYDEF